MTTVNLMITTACDRRCPYCNVNIPSTAPVHFPAEDILRLAPILGHVPLLCVTGGEPTIHPQFCELVPAIAREFKYGMLVLMSNGSGLLRNASVLHHFHAIGISGYSADSYPGCRDNAEEIAAFRAAYPEARVTVFPQRHNPRPKVGRKGRCDKLHTTASLLAGRIYPCCVSCGLAGAPSVELTPQWRDEVLRLIPPCDLCRSGPD